MMDCTCEACNGDQGDPELCLGWHGNRTVSPPDTSGGCPEWGLLSVCCCSQHPRELARQGRGKMRYAQLPQLASGV